MTHNKNQRPASQIVSICTNAHAYCSYQIEQILPWLGSQSITSVRPDVSGRQKDMVDSPYAAAPKVSLNEQMMLQNDKVHGAPSLDFATWKDLLRPMAGRYHPEGIEPDAFVGRVHARNICGFVSLELGCNAPRIQRTKEDLRLDGVDHYFAVFQAAGGATIVQNDQAVQLDVGDAALADSTMPGTYFAKDGSAQWFSLQLPRRSLISHLGFAPSGGLLGRGNTVAGRLLFELVRDARRDEPTLPPSRSYMQLAIYDLIGALFASSDPAPISVHANKLFKRTCDIIMDRFTDPSFGPCEVAAEAGISLRYLQKLFTAQNSTCSHFIQSVRLDHASRLLRRQKLLATDQPLSETAYASGFSDYTNFARRFRRRFGHTPGAHCRDDE